MNDLGTTGMSEIFVRWFISIGAAILLSISSTYSSASSPKTLSFVLDNDILVPNSRDQDYTGGLSVSYVSEDTNEPFMYFATALDSLDSSFGVENSKDNLFGIEFGLYGFTPEDTQVTGVNENYRPY